MTAIASLHSTWARLKAKGHCVGVTAFDLSAAFDNVPHDILLKKLDIYGVKGKENAWINSFLSERVQKVRWGKTLSTARKAHGGVDQVPSAEDRTSATTVPPYPKERTSSSGRRHMHLQTEIRACSIWHTSHESG